MIMFDIQGCSRMGHETRSLGSCSVFGIKNRLSYLRSGDDEVSSLFHYRFVTI